MATKKTGKPSISEFRSTRGVDEPSIYEKPDPSFNADEHFGKKSVQQLMFERLATMFGPVQTYQAMGQQLMAPASGNLAPYVAGQAMDAGQQTVQQLNQLQQTGLKAVQKVQTKQIEEAMAAGVPAENVLAQLGVPLVNQSTQGMGGAINDQSAPMAGRADIGSMRSNAPTQPGAPMAAPADAQLGQFTGQGPQVPFVSPMAQGGKQSAIMGLPGMKALFGQNNIDSNGQWKAGGLFGAFSGPTIDQYASMMSGAAMIPQNQLNLKRAEGQLPMTRGKREEIELSGEFELAKHRATKARELSNKLFDFGNKVGDDFTTATKDYAKKFQDYANIKQLAASKASGMSDLALAYSFIHYLDPNAVREGEIQNIKGASSIISQKVKGLKSVFKGQFLTPEARKALKNAARTKYKSEFSGYEHHIKSHSNKLAQQGLDPKEFLVDSSVTIDERSKATGAAATARSMRVKVSPNADPALIAEAKRRGMTLE